MVSCCHRKLAVGTKVSVCVCVCVCACVCVFDGRRAGCSLLLHMQLLNLMQQNVMRITYEVYIHDYSLYYGYRVPL